MHREGRWAGNTQPRAMRVAWRTVRADHFETILFLARLRDLMVERKSG